LSSRAWLAIPPGKIGDITKAALVLILFEHKAILKIAENLDEFGYVGVSDL